MRGPPPAATHEAAGVVLREAAAAAREASIAAQQAAHSAQQAAYLAAHPAGDPLAFFLAAATIIPVMFFALIYQSEIFNVTHDPNEAESRAFFLVFLAVVAIASEFVCLLVLATRTPSPPQIMSVSSGVMLLGLVIAVGIAYRVIEPIGPALRNKLEAGFAAAALGAYVAGYATLWINLHLSLFWFLP